MKLLIIADDFTGALDTGVKLSREKISTCVFTGLDLSDNCLLPEPPTQSEVLVIDAKLRHETPAKAYEYTHRLLERYPAEYVYLKTDSVLRGNISAVFAAGLHAIAKPLCFVPAFPELGRTTRDAVAYVNCTLLENSVFRDDPRTPTTDSNIFHILSKDYPVGCSSYKLLTASASKDGVTRFLSSDERFYPSSDEVSLFNCETEAELTDIGKFICKNGLYGFTAGCAGFAATFSSNIDFQKEERAEESIKSPVLFISGSANAVTLSQLAYAKKLGYPVFSLSEHIFSSYKKNKICDTKKLSLDRDFQKLAKECTHLLLQGQSVVLATAVQAEQIVRPAEDKADKESEKYLHKYIADYTSFLVKSIIMSDCTRQLAIFGGDMVSAVLDGLFVHQVEARGELTSGVALCHFHTNGQTYRLVSKSGGFGEESIIPFIDSFLFRKQ